MSDTVGPHVISKGIRKYVGTHKLINRHCVFKHQMLRMSSQCLSFISLQLTTLHIISIKHNEKKQKKKKESENKQPGSQTKSEKKKHLTPQNKTTTQNHK